MTIDTEAHCRITACVREALELADEAGLLTVGIHLDATLLALGLPGVVRAAPTNDDMAILTGDRRKITNELKSPWRDHQRAEQPRFRCK